MGEWGFLDSRRYLIHDRDMKFTDAFRAIVKFYLVPFLLGRNPQPLDIWHASNLEWIEYAVEVPQELLNLWDDVALQWAREVSVLN